MSSSRCLCAGSAYCTYILLRKITEKYWPGRGLPMKKRDCVPRNLWHSSMNPPTMKMKMTSLDWMIYAELECLYPNAVVGNEEHQRPIERVNTIEGYIPLIMLFVCISATLQPYSLVGDLMRSNLAWPLATLYHHIVLAL